MPKRTASPKTAAETSTSVRIPRALYEEVRATVGEIEALPPRGLPVPSAADLVVASIRAGLATAREAFGVPVKVARKIRTVA